MRKIAILALLVIPFVLSCATNKPKKKKHEKIYAIPPGKWTESKRMKFDSTLLDFNDSIHIEFITIKNKPVKNDTAKKKDQKPLMEYKYVWRRSKGFIYKGDYQLDDTDITMGRFHMVIMDIRKGKSMVLRDEKTYYIFMPDTSSISYANTNIKFGVPVDTNKPVTSIDQMVGHWSVYKRKAASQLEVVDYNKTIKMMDITGGSTDSSLGYIYSTLDPPDAPSWKIKGFSKQVLEAEGATKRTFKVIRCESKELIMEEEGMTYYFKQFR